MKAAEAKMLSPLPLADNKHAISFLVAQVEESLHAGIYVALDGAMMQKLVRDDS